MPLAVVEIRKNLCQGKCDVDPTDPCASCPNGHWGRYTVQGCEGGIRPTVEEPQLRIGSTFRPGEIFSLVIFKITGQKTANCGICGQRKMQMNRWGWWGCWKNRKVLTGWLIEEAKKRGHDINEDSALSLLKAALKETRLLTYSNSAITNPQQRR